MLSWCGSLVMCDSPTTAQTSGRCSIYFTAATSVTAYVPCLWFTKETITKVYRQDVARLHFQCKTSFQPLGTCACCMNRSIGSFSSQHIYMHMRPLDNQRCTRTIRPLLLVTCCLCPRWLAICCSQLSLVEALCIFIHHGALGLFVCLRCLIP